MAWGQAAEIWQYWLASQYPSLKPQASSLGGGLDGQYPSAMPSLRDSVAPKYTPVAGSRQIAW